ncbi:unnamed protein product [Ilex paraguariensis]|uniref:SBP-type domain-containing protein n=1 Tax=Ilex paraguariensis TaxID=185542 RepID=A0ABC8U556_9AQUA
MTPSSAMEWNAKWDRENLVMFSTKGIESPKKLQLTDWGIVEDGEFDVEYFNLPGRSGVSGSSGSNGAHDYSTKSSISATTNSSSKGEIKTSNFTFEVFEGFPGDFNKRELVRAEQSTTSPPLETSVGSGEPLIGLKLGKRTYFENNGAGSNNKTPSVSVVPVKSATTAKKIKSSCQSAPTPRCQVEGCNLDLSSAKEYHRKHRVCESHSKSSKVNVGGLERRFCQQCSRFHSLPEFDEKKRSCRRRLSDHNARRRKPQQETVQFNSTRLSSFYDGGKQMNFVLNNAPLLHSRPAADSTWETTCSSQFTLTKGFSLKPQKAGSSDGVPHLPGIQLPHAISIPGHDSNSIMSFKGTTTEVLGQGSKESMRPRTLDAALDIHRALSLLSTTSWGSCEPESIDHPIMHAAHTSMPQHVMHAVPQNLPLASSEYWQVEQQSTDPLAVTMPANRNSNSHFQEIHLLKTPFETDFFLNPFN